MRLGSVTSPIPKRQPGWVDTTLSAQQLDNPDWVSQWGYGLFFGENPIQISFWDDPLHSESDPNREIFESLSPSEQEAWEATLGRPQTWGDDCRRRANDTVMAEQPFNIFLEDEFRPLFEVWQGISADWTNSEGYLAANADWSNCMADSGYPGFDNRIDANNQIGEELFTYRIAERRIGFPQATPQTSPELADLQQREIELALADLNCRTEVNFQARLDASRIEIETQFVNDHQTALKALRDAAEQRGLNWNIWD